MSNSLDNSDLDDYIEDYYMNVYHEESVIDVWENCVVLSVLSIYWTIWKIVLLNLCFAVISTTGWTSKWLNHFITGIIGIYLVSGLSSTEGKSLLVVCWISCYLAVIFSYKLRLFSANFVKVLSIFILFLCEYFLIKPETWLQIRGIVMILIMKVISLVDDIEKFGVIPNFIQYFGYTLSGANIMFGPWISFSDYLNFFEKPTRKNLAWAWSLIQVLFASLLFLTLSNCWGSFLINDTANRWLIAYREAFCFRTSHYFISYLAEAGMISAGFFKSGNPNQFRYVVTEPREIEFPSSLSVVVKKWNQPMHEFLKKYIYRSWQGYGKFSAILATFLISSFLHGLEIKVSIVLVSLGLFSLIQVAARDKIAMIFDCCVRVRSCKDCNHKYKRSSIIVMAILILYSIFTIVHLAYLGVLMDSSTDEVGIFGKWQDLYFISHIIMCINVLLLL